MLMDMSSEMIHSLLPLFLVSALGASTLAVGVIEGVAEATASITKIFSGTLSDRIGRRKVLTIIGYGMAALTKPMFPLATTVGWVVTARVVDRVGKGIRGAPRDALVADLAPPELRGASYGLRQSLDTVGAFAGPLLAIAFMALSGDDFRFVFWLATVPAFAAVALLIVGVREPAEPRGGGRAPLRVSDVRELGLAYWWVVAVASVLALARFSEAFLVLRAQSVGLAIALAPMVMVIMNVVYALTAYPAGYLSDRLGRRHVVAVGVLLLVGGDVVLARAGGVAELTVGIVLWGLHMGLTQGTFSALVADTSPTRLRGTAFGIFNLLGGAATLAASVLAGWLWSRYGPAATFHVAAVVAFVALAGLVLGSAAFTQRARGR
ncbi:MAG TPA: MFS transporter [Methylomirabilota bacterium]|jgi:MFS family permease|nr:MFS transporter [Methylomirabilota bacterium]